MKKKLMALVLMCTMVFALVACGGDKKSDTSNAGGVAGQTEERTGTLVYSLPEEFSVEIVEGQWVTSAYPNDTSSIVIQSMEDDPYGINYTEDEFVELVSVLYEAQGCVVGEINMVEFTKSELNGFETLLIDCKYNLQMEVEGTMVNADIRQIEFVAQIGNVTHAITYTDITQDGWYEKFRESVATIDIQ